MENCGPTVSPSEGELTVTVGAVLSMVIDISS